MNSELYYIIERSRVCSTDEIKAITEAYNALGDDKESVKDMFLYKDFVYITTHLHRPINQTFICDLGEQIIFASTQNEMQYKLDEVDLFLYPNLIPAEVQTILDGFEAGESYELCASVLKQVESLGYTFNYYLDAMPTELKKI